MRPTAKLTLALLIGLATTIVVLLALSSLDARAATLVLNHITSLTCPGSTTLENLVTCIAGNMPGRDSEGFIAPTQTIQIAWRSVVTQMLDGQCNSIILPIGLSGVYSVSTFNDMSNGQSYCVLMEILDQDNNSKVDRGWGTFIVNSSPSRELNIQIAHPLSDIDTEDEGIGIFKGTNSRSFLMAGAHREANSITATCQSQYQADVAHDVENLFQPTVEELLEFYNDRGRGWGAIQFHGMAASSCPGVNVYLTHGMSTTPAAGDRILELKSNLLNHNPTWTVTVPGDSPSCDLHGSDNVQGRLLNDVITSSVCTTPALSYSGRFVHIEQKACCRNADDWIVAINETWPRTLYVATDGDDANDCSTIANRCRTVQQAVDQATTGDEIRIAGGVYTDTDTAGLGYVVALTKTVTLRGGWNASFTTQDFVNTPTTLDAERAGRVIYINGNITPTIEGLILTRGNATGRGGQGGGLYSQGAFLLVRHSIISDSVANTTGIGFGGGIYLVNSTATLTDTQVVSNTASTASYGYGGGLAVDGSTVTLSDTQVMSNTASMGYEGFGGGLSLDSSMVSLDSATSVLSNTASTAGVGYGGGLYLSDVSTTTLAGTYIVSNTASTASDGYGGGLYLSDSTANLNNTAVVGGNTGASGIGFGYGGGLCLSRSTANLSGATIVQDNTASSCGGGYGGGLFLQDQSIANLSDAAIVQNNTADSDAISIGSGFGGGFFLRTGSTTNLESGTLVRANTASIRGSGHGGGLYLEVSTVTLSGTQMVSNVASISGTGYGGGIYLYSGGWAILTNTQVMSNTATTSGTGDGGGLYSLTGATTAANSVIAHNAREGLYIDGGSHTFVNCTLSDNALTGIRVVRDTLVLTNTIIARHDVGINQTGGTVIAGYTLFSNTANIIGSVTNNKAVYGDPRFVDAAGGDYHLQAGSAAIDQGDPAGTTAVGGPAPTMDFDGEERPFGTRVDIGADEFPAKLSVTKQASPDPVSAGAQLTYTIRVTNTGNVDLHAMVTDTLPIHITPTGTLTWTTGMIAPDSIWTKTVVVTVEVGYVGTLTNTVQVTTDEGAAGIYTATSATSIPALMVSKQANPDPVPAGERLTYTIRVTNTGNVTLHALVTDTLPTHITPGQTSSGMLILPGGTLTWTPAITMPSGVWTETIVVTVELGYAGLLTNALQVTTDEGATGIYTETTAVFVPCAGLTGIEFVGPLTGTIGAANIFTATVGPLEATLPITYTWQATGQSGVVTTTNTLSHAVSFAWMTAGPKIITVTAVNACSVQVTTHTVTVEESCHALTDVELAGSLTGTLGAANTFTATVGPLEATLPVTYSWQATGQSDVVTTTNTLSHTVSFAWMTAGPKIITVMAVNACSVQVTTHTVAVEESCHALTDVELAGPLTGTIGAAYTFTAAVGSLEATLPITYTWRATEQTPVTHTVSRVTDTVAFTWAIIGTKTVVVTATNACEVVSNHYSVDVQWWRVYLPLVMKH